MNKNNYVVIMAGGVGSRFWPLSKEKHPKQFIDILNTGSTLLQATFNRFAKIISIDNIFIVTSNEYKNLVQKQLPLMKIDNILLEHQRKNTAPCIAYANYKINSKNENANIIFAPADSHITGEKQFINDCKKALNFSQKNEAIVTIGITPSFPSTGFGYIESQNKFENDSIEKVKKFAEKPDLKTAKKYLKTGNFLWNAGTFIARSKTMINEFEKNANSLHQLFLGIQNSYYSKSEVKEIKKIYDTCESISIDYAIIEKSKNIFVKQATFTWSDLGIWTSVFENMYKDENNNAFNNENIISDNAKNNLIISNPQKITVINGLNNIIVVDTHDALLISCKTQEQEIKNLVNKLKTNNRNKFL